MNGAIPVHAGRLAHFSYRHIHVLEWNTITLLETSFRKESPIVLRRLRMQVQTIPSLA
jgi:hypothetical protein